MKVVDILKTKHSVLKTVDGYTYHQDVYDYTQTDMTLKDILFCLGPRYKEPINILRQMEYHSDEQNEYKKKFPSWFVGGTFPFMNTKDEDIITYSNIVAIDIDKKDNPDIDLDEIRKELFDLWYVFGVLYSISGKGIYALVLVEDGHYTKEYYKYLARLWSQKYGLSIDEKCTNIGRKRFISYEDDIDKWIKPDNNDITPWKLKYIEKEQTQPIQTQLFKPNNNDTLVSKAIWKLLNNGFSIDDFNTKDNQYSVWYYVACDFHHFDDGYNMFVRFSQNSSKYNDNIKTIDKKYNDGKIINTLDDVSRKWCGMCKRKYGIKWWKD